ncbi:hypothetical protein ACIBHX_28260 [Nonomuraea sp. NPDC050536]|uniref:hypothetical protein n=1 Tax=Nonomuraea sp. NPDC050536 TaxID=3364366 RepID=UPI0037C7B4B5
MRIAVAGAVLAATAALTLVPGAAPAGATTADADCGGSTKYSFNPYTKVRTWKMTWTNCVRGSRKKIDIARGPDLHCYYIPAGTSHTWWFSSRVEIFAPYPRGFKNC